MSLDSLMGLMKDNEHQQVQPLWFLVNPLLKFLFIWFRDELVKFVGNVKNFDKKLNNYSNIIAATCDFCPEDFKNDYVLMARNSGVIV